MNDLTITAEATIGKKRRTTTEVQAMSTVFKGIPTQMNNMQVQEMRTIHTRTTTVILSMKDSMIVSLLGNRLTSSVLHQGTKSVTMLTTIRISMMSNLCRLPYNLGIPIAIKPQRSSVVRCLEI